jgi:hypothetical protein
LLLGLILNSATNVTQNLQRKEKKAVQDREKGIALRRRLYIATVNYRLRKGLLLVERGSYRNSTVMAGLSVRGIHAGCHSLLRGGRRKRRLRSG